MSEQQEEREITLSRLQSILAFVIILQFVVIIILGWFVAYIYINLADLIEYLAWFMDTWGYIPFF